MNVPIVINGKERYRDSRRVESSQSCVIYRADRDGPVIIKKFKIDEYCRIYDHIVREMAILCHINHPNIANLQEIWSEPNYPSLILEDSGSSLWNHAIQFNRAGRAKMFDSVFGQVLTALNYLHMNNIIHRDIKASNVLIKGTTVKLCDFGLARRITGDDMGTLAYTLNYRPPEVIAENSNYGLPADMWAVACMMYDFITHVILFGKGCADDDDMMILDSILLEVPTTKEELAKINIESEIPDGIKWAKIDQLESLLQSKTVDMIKALLSINPTNRPTASGCLQILEIIPDPVEVIPVPFQVRKKIKSDLNIRYIMVVHILEIGNQFPVSYFTIAAAVEIYDKFLTVNQEKDLDQTKLILYYIASIIIASCIHDSHKLFPADFESVYKETEIISAMKSLFQEIRYDSDITSLWQIVYDQVQLGNLKNTEESLDNYWETIKSIYLDYESMVDLDKSQMTEMIMKQIKK